MVKSYAMIKTPTHKGTVMARFIGEYNHQLDAKNRLRIPAKLKKELGDEYYFTRGTNNTIKVVTKEEMQATLDKLAEIKYSNLELQKSVRFISSSFVPAVEDNQGRVVLPTELKAHALMGKDDKDLVICGAVNRIEIWSKKVHDEYFASSPEDFDSLIAKLVDLW